jgi:hypothetical protein
LYLCPVFSEYIPVYIVGDKMSSVDVCLQRSLIYLIFMCFSLYLFILHHAELYMRVLSSVSLWVLVICTCNILRFLSAHHNGMVTQRWRKFVVGACSYIQCSIKQSWAVFVDVCMLCSWDVCVTVCCWYNVTSFTYFYRCVCVCMYICRYVLKLRRQSLHVNDVSFKNKQLDTKTL